MFIYLIILISLAHSAIGLLRLSKCCSTDQLLVLTAPMKYGCVDHNASDKVDFSSINITDGKGTNEKTVKYSSVFDVTINAFKDPSFHENAMTPKSLKTVDAVYMTENAELVLHRTVKKLDDMHEILTKIEHPNFCFDFFRSLTKNQTYWAFWYNTMAINNSESEQAQMLKDYFLTAAMFISCGFLLLVLIVYGLLPKLRNMCGCILMAYIASLLLAFLHLAIIRLKVHSIDVCYSLTLIVYYTLLASFCWMTVMSYDIWWTFRGYAKSRLIHRRGKTFKFVMYSIYAWGVPLAMTIFVACIDEADLGPQFIKPHLRVGPCFLDGYEKFRYLYIPILILIGTNWMFYMMTAFNIWRLSRGTAVLDSAAAGTPAVHRSHRQRFLVYLKLSVVMGLNWVLEVASYLYPDFMVWYITDAYNFLIGVFIFIIFVCKKKILKDLIKLFLKETSKSQGTHSNSKYNSTFDICRETQPLQVTAKPRDQGYVVNNF